MQAGEALGQILGQKAFTLGGKWLLLLICTGLLIGAIVVCAEPAVWVLTEQVELISGGSIKRKILLSFLAVGAAIAIGLALWRAIAGFNLKYILVCIINKRQIGEMMKIIKGHPDTFASFEKVSEVFGNFKRHV